MKTTFDQLTGVKIWHLDRWYQKTFYVLGITFVVLWGIGILSAIFNGDF